MNIAKPIIALAAIVMLAAWTPEEANRRADGANVNVGDKCSGTVIDKKRRLIATAWHCIRSNLSYRNEAIFFPDGHRIVKMIEMRAPVTIHQNIYDDDGNLAISISTTAYIVGYLELEDVAVLKVENAAILFGDQAPLSRKKVRRGDSIWHIGNPFMLEGWVSRGTITSTTQRVRDGKHENMPVIFFDASMEPGSSGGALYNEDGELIGLTNWAIPGTGVKAASPVSNLILLLDKLGIRRGL